MIVPLFNECIAMNIPSSHHPTRPKTSDPKTGPKEANDLWSALDFAHISHVQDIYANLSKISTLIYDLHNLYQKKHEINKLCICIKYITHVHVYIYIILNDSRMQRQRNQSMWGYHLPPASELSKKKVKFPAETVILVGGIYALKPSKNPPNKM